MNVNIYTELDDTSLKDVTKLTHKAETYNFKLICIGFKTSENTVDVYPALSSRLDDNIKQYIKDDLLFLNKVSSITSNQAYLMGTSNEKQSQSYTGIVVDIDPSLWIPEQFHPQNPSDLESISAPDGRVVYATKTKEGKIVLNKIVGMIPQS